MTLRMVTTSLDICNGQSAAKRLSNGERSETVRDGMGAAHACACLTFSPTPAKAELQARKEAAEMRLWRALRRCELQ